MQNIQRNYIIPLSDRQHVEAPRYAYMTESEQDAATAGHAEVTLSYLFRTKHSADPVERAKYEDMRGEWMYAENQLWCAARAGDLSMFSPVNWKAVFNGLVILAYVLGVGAVSVWFAVDVWPAIAASWHTVSGGGLGR